MNDFLKIKKMDDRLVPMYLDKDKIIQNLTKNVLIGFPRSGNTALRLFLEMYSKRPTGRPLKINSLAIGTNMKSSVLFSKNKMIDLFNSTKPILTKIHKFWELDLLKEDKVIYLLRDYKDCIPAILKFDDETFSNWYSKRDYNNEYYGYDKYEDFIEKLIEYSYNYGEQLKQFVFIPNEKILIYYEDFISDFNFTAKKILDFLGLEINEERIKICNIINNQGREITDAHFNRIGRNEKQINLGCTKFIGEYSDVLKKRDINILETLFKKQLGDALFKKLLGRYQ